MALSLQGGRTVSETMGQEDDDMSDKNLRTRREFTVESALAMLAGVSITISGCGGDDNNTTTSPSPTATDRTGTVSTDAGHTHTGAVITAAQFTAGNALTLTLAAGATGHTHTVAISQSELTQISGGTRVQKVSSNDSAHTHTVTFN
jgi:hypothetical protein